MEFYVIFLIIGIILLFELLFYTLVRFVNKKFQWLIIGKDEYPILSKIGLQKFIPHGYDYEFGWIRKPNTSDIEKGKEGTTRWSINSKGCRTNPNFDNLESKISCYGDSFTFCRQVNDNETWEHYLSKLQKTNVQNFGVGNYGLDQSLLRLKREYPKNKTSIVILAVVPDTISRILSSWKHYYEYGNTFAFKPRFIFKDNKLVLVKNIIDDKSKFNNYIDYLPQIQSTDFFYKNKFKKEILKFPYSITIFKNPFRNFKIIFWIITIELLKKFRFSFKKFEWNSMKTIMKINLGWRIHLYKNKEAINLLEKLILEFISYAKQHNFKPVLVIMPQKDDINFIKNNEHFYKKFIDSQKNLQEILVIDICDEFLLEDNLDDLFSDENEYGGHLSKIGNKRIAQIIDNKFKNI